MKIKTVVESDKEIFREGDIVELKGHSRIVIGKIKYIDLSWIEIDCSSRFKSSVRKEDLKDFYSIKHYEESEE